MNLFLILNISVILSELLLKALLIEPCFVKSPIGHPELGLDKEDWSN